jgi:hypothetical protein
MMPHPKTRKKRSKDCIDKGVSDIRKALLILSKIGGAVSEEAVPVGQLLGHVLVGEQLSILNGQITMLNNSLTRIATALESSNQINAESPAQE